ncbi:unnamed protein product [Bursaphelenchus okinawaensis]|uniref:MSP domain-containing protein n=1 Tax=Bursaphelenchus okinawaensis TaxID=465554 RepID=A0A811KR23_9BILA|nr:unnamed protein product [Bursaphelenchus okinawaensis]CAG9112192.1 unnamed protein product [Bursaphelenchus okinawaensis]
MLAISNANHGKAQQVSVARPYRRVVGSVFDEHIEIINLTNTWVQVRVKTSECYKAEFGVLMLKAGTGTTIVVHGDCWNGCVDHTIVEYQED